MRFKTVSIAAGFVFCAAVLCCMILYIALPGIAQIYIEKKLSQTASLPPIAFKIEKIGLRGAGLTDVQVKDAVKVDRVFIGYHLNGASGIRPEKVVIAGLNITARIDEKGMVQLPGIELPGKGAGPKEAKTITGFLPDKIVLKNSVVSLQVKEKTYRIPLEILSTVEAQKNRVACQISAFPFGEKINVVIAYDLERGIEKISTWAEHFNLSCLDTLIREMTALKKLPPLGEITDFKADFVSEDMLFKGSGRMTFRHPAAGSIPLEYRADFSLEKEPVFNAEISTGNIEHMMWENVSGKAKISNPSVSVIVNGSQKEIAGKFRMETKAVEMVSGRSTAYFPGIEAGGNFERDEKGVFSSEMVLTASGGTADLPEYHAGISGISFDVPYHYPASAEPKKGSCAVKKITYKEKYAFNIKGQTVQTGPASMRITGKAASNLIKKTGVNFTLLAGYEKQAAAALDFNIDPFLLTEKEVKKLVPKAIRNAGISAQVSAKGRVALEKNKIKSSMTAEVKNADFYNPDMKLTAKGAQTVVRFNNLLVPETVPGQVLTVESLEVNKIKISDVKVRFSLEDAASLLIENIRFKWCNGLVTTEAIRFPQENGSYELSLFCDRLELTQLLEQAGAFQAEGSGTLNGRIPVIYENGDISFEDGFLFSTPGSGGKIRIENTDKLTAGIPLDSPQFAELDVAREALKDFSYEWAKLAFHTFEDTLFVNMELDGKPSRVMPFEYKKEIGRFIRVDASSPGSNFQGIKLDVNLNLPFNEVMKFGNKMKSIFN